MSRDGASEGILITLNGVGTTSADHNRYCWSYGDKYKAVVNNKKPFYYVILNLPCTEMLTLLLVTVMDPLVTLQVYPPESACTREEKVSVSDACTVSSAVPFVGRCATPSSTGCAGECVALSSSQWTTTTSQHDC